MEVCQKFHKDLCVSFATAASTPRSDLVAADAELGPFLIPSARNALIKNTNDYLHKIATLLPNDVLNIIAEFHNENFVKRKFRNAILPELAAVTCVLRYGLCDIQPCRCCKTIFSRWKSDRKRHWDYLDVCRRSDDDTSDDTSDDDDYYDEEYVYDVDDAELFPDEGEESELYTLLNNIDMVEVSV